MTKLRLTHQELKELLHYDPETGVFTRIIRSGSRVKIGDTAGGLDKYGYIIISVGGKSYKSHRLAWLYITEKWPKDQIDHINHIRNDNRFKNLREVTHQENHKNQSMQKNNTSGCTGVYYYKPTNKWVVRIKVDGKNKNLGYYESFNDAVEVRKKAEVELDFHNNHGV